MNEQERNICQAVLERIQKEKRNNFSQLVPNRHYNSAAHQKAVTQDSLELFRDAMSQLSLVRGFLHEAIALYHLTEHELSLPANKREATRILAVTEQLEQRLKKQTGGMKA